MNGSTDIMMSKTTDLVNELDSLKQQQAEAVAQAKKWKKQAEAYAAEIERISQELGK